MGFAERSAPTYPMANLIADPHRISQAAHRAHGAQTPRAPCGALGDSGDDSPVITTAMTGWSSLLLM